VIRVYNVAGKLIEVHRHKGDFKERSQLFVGVHNETFSVAAVRVSNPDRSPVRVDSCDTALTRIGGAELSHRQ
jgi:hypothetical protein